MMVRNSNLTPSPWIVVAAMICGGELLERNGEPFGGGLPCRVPISRRSWLKSAAAAGTCLLVLRDSRSARATCRIGGGCRPGGPCGAWRVVRRYNSTDQRESHSALDVNGPHQAAAYAKHPDVPKFRDFRQMLDEAEPQIDAVIVAAGPYQRHRGRGDAGRKARLLRETAGPRRG